MTHFTFFKNPLESFNNHINEFESNIPKIIVKHSEGRHGSDKGCCEWCGKSNPNIFCECEEATQRAKKRGLEHVAELRKLYDIIKPMSKEDQKLLFKYIGI